MIPGVRVRELKDILNERGGIQHMLRADDADFFSGFGEVYFSLIHPQVTKGWHRHQEQTSVLSCVKGRILLVLTDGHAVQEVPMGDGVRKLVKIPPGVAYAWKNLGEDTAILANCASHVYDPQRSETLPLDSFPYAWPHESS